MDHESDVTNPEVPGKAPLSKRWGRSGLVAAVVLAVLLGAMVSVSLAQTTPSSSPAPAVPTASRAASVPGASGAPAAPGGVPTAVVPTTLAAPKPQQFLPGTYVYQLGAGVLKGAVTIPLSLTGVLSVEAALGKQQQQAMRWLNASGAVDGTDSSMYEFADDGIYLASTEGTNRTSIPTAKFDMATPQLITPWPAQVDKTWAGHVISTDGCQVLATRVKVEGDNAVVDVDGSEVSAVRLVRLTERSSTGKSGCSDFSLNETTTSWISLKYGLVQEHRVISETAPTPSTFGYILRLVGVPPDPAPAPAPVATPAPAPGASARALAPTVAR